MRTRTLLIMAIVAIIVAAGAVAGWIGYERRHQKRLQTERGEAVFVAHCKACHDPPIEEAPGRSALVVLSPQDIVATMATGSMRAAAEGLSPEDRLAVATYLGSSL